MRIVKKQEEIW